MELVMNFQLDHDYHIHSQLSLCSGDAAQTAAAILKYAEDNHLKEICLTDHFWDERVPGASDWYRVQGYERLSSVLPLPQGEGVRFFFGCETELDKHMTLGIADKTMEQFDFIIIPTTHLHMTGFTVDEQKTSVEERAALYVERLDKLLDLDLPFHKIGIAHLTCPLIAWNRSKDFDEHLRILDEIDDATYRELFSKLAGRGAGFELNFTPADYSQEQLPRVLRPYLLAKEVGCKFYLGSDAHRPANLAYAPKRFADMVTALALEETERYRFC